MAPTSSPLRPFRNQYYYCDHFNQFVDGFSLTHTSKMAVLKCIYLLGDWAACFSVDGSHWNAGLPSLSHIPSWLCDGVREHTAGWRMNTWWPHTDNRNKCWLYFDVFFLVWGYYDCRDCGHLVVRLKSLLWNATTILFSHSSRRLSSSAILSARQCQFSFSSLSDSRSCLWIRVVYVVVNKRPGPVEEGHINYVLPEVKKKMAEVIHACIQAWHIVFSSS